MPLFELELQIQDRRFCIVEAETEQGAIDSFYEDPFYYTDSVDFDIMSIREVEGEE